MKMRLCNDKGYTQVFIDGQEIHRVTSIEFKESVSERPSLVLEMYPDEIEADIDGCQIDVIDLVAKQKKEQEMREGYSDFIKFLFGNFKKQ